MKYIGGGNPDYDIKGGGGIKEDMGGIGIAIGGGIGMKEGQSGCQITCSLELMGSSGMSGLIASTFIQGFLQISSTVSGLDINYNDS